jgi:hypothetical protein
LAREVPLACGIFSVFQQAYFTGQLFDFEFQNVSISAFDIMFSLAREVPWPVESVSYSSRLPLLHRATSPGYFTGQLSAFWSHSPVVSRQ